MWLAIAAAAAQPLPAHLDLPDAGAAVAHVLSTFPADGSHVLGVGELHAKTGGPQVPTALSRFTAEVLPVLATRASDLVLESWRVDETCGDVAAKVSGKVAKDTRRPVETKSELATLAEAALAAGIAPHDLAFSCAEYATIQGKDGAVDYGVLLSLLTRKLGDFADQALSMPDASLVIYGGAVHNDVSPPDSSRAYSYGVRAAEHGGGRYIELDLYVPELLAGNPDLVEPAWAPLIGATGPDHVVLYERNPQSYVLLLESTPPR